MKSPLIPTSSQHKANNIMLNFETTTTTTIPFHNNVNHKRRAKTPSFSSILLDSIYRSIDDTDTNSLYQHDHHPTTTSINHNHNYKHMEASSKQRRTKMRSDSTLETIDLRHAIMIESWIEKHPLPSQPQQIQQQRYYHKHNDADYDNIKITRQKSVPSRSSSKAISFDNSTTTSNFTSSASTSSSCFTPSMIRTTFTPRSADSYLHAPPKARDREHEITSRIFTKTKSRALKIYSELKKAKQQQHHHRNQQQQPISPGARIAAFLNSIFRNTSNSPPSTKKQPSSTSTSACSSASSFSRSCLSKTTTPSTGKSKRSVRFYPTSVILDEESTPCGQKPSLCKDNNDTLHNDGNIVDEQNLLLIPSSSKAAASDHQQQQRKWKREAEIDTLMMMIKRNCRSTSSKNDGEYYKEVLSIVSDSDEEMINVDEDEDDDGDSCASSDLFELENLSSIGVSRFSQELPVYGTTSLKNLTA